MTVNPRTAIALRQLKMKFQAVFSTWIRLNLNNRGRGGNRTAANNLELPTKAIRVLDLMRQVIENKHFVPEAK